MGYSISAPIKDKATHEKMLKFLAENYQHPNYMIYSSDPKTVLDYDDGKLIIGFDYKSGCSINEWNWVWAVSKWIATTVGKTHKFKKDNDGLFKISISKKLIPQPYLRYDGDSELIPISVTHTFDKLPDNLKSKLNILSDKWQEENNGTNNRLFSRTKSNLE